jgi:outer membrane protein OmpA-like peptidoglycan-associated protein
MNQSRTTVGRLALGLLVPVLVAGCATKGFVRRQVDTLRQGEAQETARLDRSVEDVRNSSQQAMERAQIAYEMAREARDVALGKMGLEEIGQSNAPFEFDSDELSSAAQAALDRAAQILQEHPGALVDIYGFADQTGNTRYNLDLGRRRADAVLRYLADRAPGNLSRFASVSYGEEKPVGPNSTREGRAQNRRVLVSVLQRASSAEKNTGSQESAPPVTS